MNESYANFGIWGVILVGAVMGCFYGFFTRLSQGLPLLSFQGLLGILAFKRLVSDGVVRRCFYCGLLPGFYRPPHVAIYLDGESYFLAQKNPGSAMRQ
jgi:hypothetical protein